MIYSIFLCLISTEQATVKAKQYIRTNVTSIRDESQGVELEFLCREQQSSSTTSSLEKSFENESETFKGFDCMEKDRAKIVHQTFFEKVNEQFIHGNVTAEKESEIILANVFISDNYRRSGKYLLYSKKFYLFYMNFISMFACRIYRKTTTNSPVFK